MLQIAFVSYQVNALSCNVLLDSFVYVVFAF